MIKLGGKELLEGMFLEGPSFELVKNEPDVKQWLKMYKEKFGREGNTFSLFGYNAIILLADVIKKANTLTDKDRIRVEMTKVNLNDLLGYRGESHFDENGQVYPSLGVLQYRDGKRVPVYEQKK